MELGWIKLHRQLLDWEWYDDINTFRLFVHCLLRANHSDSKWRGIDVKRGAFITSLETLNKETGLSVSQIRTALKKLISTGELASKSQAKSRIITVLGYDSYQHSDKQVSKQLAGKSQGSDKQVTTDKNVRSKECKNEINKDTLPAVNPPSYSKDDHNCALWFYDLLLKLNPKHKKPNFDTWANDIRKIVNIDKRTYQEISDLMLWVNQDHFWQTNILSPKKLREKWDALTMQKNKVRYNKTEARTINNLSVGEDFLNEH